MNRLPVEPIGNRHAKISLSNDEFHPDVDGVRLLPPLLRAAAAGRGDDKLAREILRIGESLFLTSIYDSLFAGLKIVENGTGRPLILLFTDGADNASWLTAADLLKVLQVSDAVVHVVGIRSKSGVTKTNRATGIQQSAPEAFRMFAPPTRPRQSSREADPESSLEKIAESTGGKFWKVDSSADLESAYLEILDEMKSRYLLSYNPEGVPEVGWHPLEVKVKGRKADDVRARPGYMLTAASSEK